MTIMSIRWTIKTMAVMALGISTFVSAQPTAKPLTNADVIAMVQANLPESVVVAAIQSRPSKFDTSPAALIRLQKAHVTQNEMEAIMAASARPAGTAPPPTPAPTPQPAVAPVPVPATTSRMPKVSFVRDGSAQELPLEKTQLAQTKTKPSSMKNLAGDSAVGQAMQAGISTAATSTAMHMSSGLGSTSVQQAGSIFAGVMSHRKPNVTYVWGVPNPASTNILQTTSPTFAVDFSRTPGVNADDYEPAIVKLTPAQNTCRIVGATEGKEDARSSPSADWQVYSHFLEERVKVNAKKLGPGKYELSAASGLFPGEYAVVLRPVSKTKNFSGGDVARAQGDGLMFDALWSFQISDSAE